MQKRISLSKRLKPILGLLKSYWSLSGKESEAIFTMVRKTLLDLLKTTELRSFLRLGKELTAAPERRSNSQLQDCRILMPKLSPKLLNLHAFIPEPDQVDIDRHWAEEMHRLKKLIHVFLLNVLREDSDLVDEAYDINTIPSPADLEDQEKRLAMILSEKGVLKNRVNPKSTRTKRIKKQRASVTKHRKTRGERAASLMNPERRKPKKSRKRNRHLGG